ncbi:hypothetical protein B5X24_HaOG203530 [Helicoverpa armigera]|uniref:Arrestin-like N-terminal domain-containing protein n=1 Tax=Helicoverpa armigera TaxID=29058 RepID=A0A2W1BX88_HELAM|nr:hypothetical protein B5X24_HaOG203530 [Helicoverpa armigera]
MGFENGVVTLNHASHTYFSGQTINGHLSFVLENSKVIHGIYVEVKGWRKVNGTTERRCWLFPRLAYTVDHISYEVCLRRTTFVCGGVTGNYFLRAGRHEFKFDCPIPVDSPSSFEGKHEHIRYCFNIVMLTTGMFSSDKKILVPFRVLSSKQQKKPIEFQLDDDWAVCVAFSQIPVKLTTGDCGVGRVLNLEVICKNKDESNTKTVVPMKQPVASEATQSIDSDPPTCKTESNEAEINKTPTLAGKKCNWNLDFQIFKKKGGRQTKPLAIGSIPLAGLPSNKLVPICGPTDGTNDFPPVVINQPLSINSPYSGGNPGFSSNENTSMIDVPMRESSPTGPPPSYWCSVSKPVSGAGNVDEPKEKNPTDPIPEAPTNHQP